MEKKVLRPHEAAEVLGVTSKTVYNLIRWGELRAVRAGRVWLIPKEALDEFLGLWKS